MVNLLHNKNLRENNILENNILDNNILDNKRYIIENLEPRLYKWYLLECEHISEFIGKKKLMFTNVRTVKQKQTLSKLGTVESKSAADLNLKKVCVLDPFAKKILTSEDARKFDHFIFGGILGDYPMRARTKKELTLRMLEAEARNIGPEQMTLDNAVYVVKEIVEKGRNLSELRFLNELELEVKEGESIIIPFKFILVDEKPLISEKLVYFLKKKKGF
ncbi:hypothetical protein HYX12_02045 [Candidatus Woesearchaeota archaeon]|nr:hypothetical protein [Candidatus Woesearchaeota archaeon]